MFHRRSAVTAVAAAFIATALAACGSNQSDEVVTLTTTVAEETTVEPSTEAQDDTSAQAQPTLADSAAESPSPAQPTLPDSAAESASPAPPAPAQAATYSVSNSSQVGGQCASDIPNVSVETGSATSCGFAIAVFNQLVGAPWNLEGRDPTVNQLPTTYVQAASPVTGQSYSMRCYAGSDRHTITCSEQGAGNDQSLQTTFSASSPAIWPSLGIYSNI